MIQTYIPNWKYVAFSVFQIDTFKQTDKQTDGHGSIDLTVDPDQEYIYFAGSATLSSACYSIGYNKLLNIFD